MEPEIIGHRSRPKSKKCGWTVVLLALAGCGSSADLSIGAQVPDPWRLLWRDDFDSIDPARWQVSEHTFTENYADFLSANATINAGILELRVNAKPAGYTGKPYAAAEMQTVQEFTYGKFLARARFAGASGITTTLFSFYDWFLHEPNSMHWNEIVIESSGTSRLYYTYSLQNLANADGRERFVTPGDVPFDTTADFHVYGYEWSPAGIAFTVDGSVVHTISADVTSQLSLPKRFVVSVYPTTRADLEGPFDPAVLPVVALYDWAAVYAYVGSDAAPDAGAD
jgi:beta-glucanase (GH16 family)